MIQRVEAGRELGKAALVDLSEALPDLISQGVTTIYLDTSRVVEFDSNTLEAILEFDALARSRGLEVAVVRPSEALTTALFVTGIWGRVDIREVPEQSLRHVHTGMPTGAPAPKPRAEPEKERETPPAVPSP